MAWDGPILTDSGGYQVWSLAALRTIRRGGRALPLAPRRRRRAPAHARAGRRGAAGARGRRPAPARRVPAAPGAARGGRGLARGARSAGPGGPTRRTWPGDGRARRCFGIVQGGMYADLRRAARGGDLRARLRRLRARRVRGRRAAGAHAGAGRAHGRRPPGRPPALPDGGGPPRRPGRRGGGGRGHVRLRPADPARPDRPGASPGRAWSPSATPPTRGPRSRSTRRAPATPAGTSRAPTCGTCSWRGSSPCTGSSRSTT